MKLAYKIKSKKVRSPKPEQTFRVLIRGDDNFDEPFTNIVEIKAKSEKEALAKAEDINGVYETELV